MTYDIIGIGIGPFNLGLAALTDSIPHLQCLFFDQHESFNWHPGLLLPNARMQVPYYADLVTLVHPQSRFSFLSFLHAKKRLFRFGIHDNPFPLRREYNAYCQWAAGQLSTCRFGRRCTGIGYDETEKRYEIRIVDIKTGVTKTFHGKHLVIGTGTSPFIPACARAIEHPLVFHASEYLFKKESLADKAHITIIGSGQSAAEIFQDLLTNGNAGRSLAWFTRSPRFFPMDYSKLTLEMTSPDYIDYFYGLDASTKSQLLRQQDALYKGINGSLIAHIYDELYGQSLEQDTIRHRLATNSELIKIRVRSDELELDFRETVQQNKFGHTTQALILATGYHYEIPSFLELIYERINWTPEGEYAVNRNYSIDGCNTFFVQNAELHTHGFNTPDLGMGPYRNAVILNQVLGYEHFTLERNIAFQTFGGTDHS
jgi:lysine N6-hydroxylase